MSAQKIGLLYKLIWPFRYLKAPREHLRIESESIPQLSILRNLDTSLTQKRISFFGDFMGMGKRRLCINTDLLQFLSSSDHLVFNLETVLTTKNSYILDKQHTDPEVFQDFCDQLGKERIIAGLANNHTGDYGTKGLNETLHVLNQDQIGYFGLMERPVFDFNDGLSIAGTSLWVGSENRMVNHTIPILEKKEQCIQYIHWGTEFSSKENKQQMNLLEELKNNGLLTVGHHSHSPQPLKYIDKHPVAFSLGNLCCSKVNSRLDSGIVLNINFQKEWSWEIQSLEWRFIKLTENDTGINIDIL